MSPLTLLHSWDTFLAKLKVTNDVSFILSSLAKRNIVGTLSCSWPEHQAIASNPHINSEIVDILLSRHNEYGYLFATLLANFDLEMPLIEKIAQANLAAYYEKVRQYKLSKTT